MRTRAAGQCEKCSDPIRGATGNPGTIHHRRPRCVGGRDDVVNMADLCFPCHVGIHANESAAMLTGWIVDHPELRPAQTPTGWVLFTDLGTYRPVDGRDAADLLRFHVPAA